MSAFGRNENINNASATAITGSSGSGGSGLKRPLPSDAAAEDDLLGSVLSSFNKNNSGSSSRNDSQQVEKKQRSITIASSLTAAGVMPVTSRPIDTATNEERIIGSTTTASSIGGSKVIATNAAMIKNTTNSILNRSTTNSNNRTFSNGPSHTKPSMANNATNRGPMRPSTQQQDRNLLLKKADEEENQDKMDHSDYYYALHRDEARVKELLQTDITGERPNLIEYRAAKRIIDQEKAEAAAARQQTTSNTTAGKPNSILAMLQKQNEKNKTVISGYGHAIGSSNGALAGSGGSSQSLAILSSLSSKASGGGNVVPNTQQALIRTSNGGLLSLGTGAVPTIRPSTAPSTIQAKQQVGLSRPNIATTTPSNPLVRPGGVRLINNQLVNFDKLQKNTAMLSASSNIQANVSQQKLEQKKKEDKLMSDIDALLSRKSTHASEAEEEWYQGFDQRMTKLSQREYAQQKASEINQLHVSAYECQVCHMITEAYPDLCKHNDHGITKVKAIKRFFQCVTCKRRTSTLINAEKDHFKIVKLPTDSRCLCEHSHWVRCGLVDAPLSVKPHETGAGSNGTTVTGDRLVTSASESTTYQDKLLMAARVSRLN